MLSGTMRDSAYGSSSVVRAASRVTVTSTGGNVAGGGPDCCPLVWASAADAVAIAIPTRAAWVASRHVDFDDGAKFRSLPVRSFLVVVATEPRHEATRVSVREPASGFRLVQPLCDCARQMVSLEALLTSHRVSTSYLVALQAPSTAKRRLRNQPVRSSILSGEVGATSVTPRKGFFSNSTSHSLSVPPRTSPSIQRHRPILVWGS